MPVVPLLGDWYPARVKQQVPDGTLVQSQQQKRRSHRKQQQLAPCAISGTNHWRGRLFLLPSLNGQGAYGEGAH